MFSNATGLVAFTSCSRWTSSSSAGAYPRPFCVRTCTTMGPSHVAACKKACSMCSMSCPSIGPAYRTPKASKKVCGATISRKADVTECTPEYASSPNAGSSRRRRRNRSRAAVYVGFNRKDVKGCDKCDTVGAYERPLSFSTITTRRPECPRLFKAS